MKIAVIDKCPSGAKYEKYFQFEFDLYHLSSKKLPKILKKDVDIEIDIDSYDFIVLVGSEAVKNYTKATVTDHAGTLVDNKFIPLTNPAVVVFKPEAKPAFERALEQLHKVIAGEVLFDDTGDWQGIQDVDEALAWVEELERDVEETGVVAVDTETTALYPRDGYVLGISLCGKLRKAAYISSDAVDERVYNVMQRIFLKYKTVFHNSKFDLKMLEYHFGFEFREDYDDTLLMHYLLDETQGTHGLKQLAIKYTRFGDYDKALDEFKKQYCKQHKIKEADFTYDLIPFDIIAPYACLTHDSFVFMEDGTKKTIGELVRAKSTERVLSYNHNTSRIEPKPINGWIKQKHASKAWLSIQLAMGSQKTQTGSLQGPKYTPDHKVYIKDKGYIEVQHIEVGDRILTQEPDLSEAGYQVLYGSLLGDGNFDSRNGSGAGFIVSQASQRAGYAKFKAELLNCHKFVTKKSRENIQHTYISNYTLLYSDLYRNLIMRSGTNRCKPEVTEEFAQLLDVRAIAIWYMDDGNLANKAQPRIWCRSMKDMEVETIIKRLEDLGMPNARLYNDQNNRFIEWDKEPAKTFFRVIAPYIHQDCRYKLPKEFAERSERYVWSKTSNRLYYATIYDIVPWDVPDSRRGYSTKWCINVEDNHNFFTDTGLVHNCIDTAATIELYQLFKPLIDKNPKLLNVYRNLLIPASTALKEIEENGIPLSADRLDFARVTLNKSIDDAANHLYSFKEVQDMELARGDRFNPNSVQQLRELLFDRLKLNPMHKLTTTGVQSTDAEVLESLDGQHPIVNSLLTLRKLTKIKNTYIDKIIPEMDKDSRIRTGFNLTSTTSGRLSSSGKFNAQQIPRDEPRVKGSIKARPGYKIVSQDLKTAEVYYAAVLSGDPKLQEVFKLGGDLHSTIAKMVFNLPCSVEEVKTLYPGDRQAAKAIN